MDDLERAEYLAKQARALADHLRKTIGKPIKRRNYLLINRAFGRAIRRDCTIISIKAAREKVFIEKEYGHLPEEDRFWAYFKTLKISPEEQERRKQGARRLREQNICLPFYQDAEKGWENPDDFWLRLYNSCVRA